MWKKIVGGRNFQKWIIIPSVFFGTQKYATGCFDAFSDDISGYNLFDMKQRILKILQITCATLP